MTGLSVPIVGQKPDEQGRIAIDQAVRILEGKGYIKHVGPKIFVVDPETIGDVERTNILPPEGFSPVFSVSS